MRLILCAALLLMAAGMCSSGEPAGTLTIKASGFRSAKGSAVAAVFSSEKGFPSKGEKAVRRASAVIRDGEAVIVVDGLPHGRYAVSVLHDENSNGRLDTGWFGVPKEGVGASQNPPLRLGPPSFTSAAFDFFSEKLEIEVKIHYVL